MTTVGIEHPQRFGSDAHARDHWVLFFDEIGIADVPIVGGKNASLGEMYRELARLGVRVPNGFAITAPAYVETLAQGGTTDRLRDVLDGLDVDDVSDLQRRAAVAREMIYSTPLPAEVERAVLDGYRTLVDQYGPELSFAVRSSATAEDLPEASFAGAHETFLNVSGEAELLDAVRRCYASMFTDRGLHYRNEAGFGHLDVAQSVTVMKMVRSDLASSGVVFTLDTESGFRDVVFITGAYGLGETVVKGTVDPDEFHVFKPTLATGHRHVLRRKRGEKAVKMTYREGKAGSSTHTVDVEPGARGIFCLDDDEVIELAEMAVAVEAHYSAKAGVPRPMDIEWAKDGIDGLLYLVQARPETVAVQRSATELVLHRLTGSGDVLASGRAVGDRIAHGTVRMVSSTAELDQVEPGDVLVADTTNPDWEPVLKKVAAVVTNRGGRTCHAAIVARELGIPAVVGTGDATINLAAGMSVTVSCAGGDEGLVLDGVVPYEVDRHDIGDLPQTRTKIQINLGNPGLAFRTASLPNSGVGLARMEFIISEDIGIHPMALVNPDRVTDPEVAAEIARRCRGYVSGSDFFVERLSEGIATIAAAFFPEQVVVRLSDFKTNEYAALLGGEAFEPVEANPMLGFRGASRYTHPGYREAFALECRAIRRVRDEMGFSNVVPMVPFCRRVADAGAVVAEMASNGLRRGENGLEIYVMCEIPNNVISLEAFAEYFDGFSIGSNDLTQLALGVDRDSELVAREFDESEPGVLELFRMAIDGCARVGRHSGFCGQAPSDRPEIARFLVETGIDAISLAPDAVVATTLAVAALEAELGR
jgi:pyruvate,water dikinase